MPQNDMSPGEQLAQQQFADNIAKAQAKQAEESKDIATPRSNVGQGNLAGYSSMGVNQQKPSIGRIVIYNHPGSSDGKYPPQKSPAIIQNVAEDGTVRLFVFGPKGQHMDEGLTYGTGPCQWQWPGLGPNPDNNSGMPAHQQRVVEEKKELDVKIYKLNDFILTNKLFPSLSMEEKERLIRQLDIMNQYSDVLCQRIAAF